jgi:outer membrane lipoprotein-sorting protein
MMRKLRHLTAVAAVLAGVLTLTACGSDSKAPSSGDQTTKSIAITFSGTSVTPNGERVDVAVGQPVEFVVKADAPGEIHVHSDPEKELKYEKGTTILKLGSFDHTGIIEVESHALEKTIVQLEVK